MYNTLVSDYIGLIIDAMTIGVELRVLQECIDFCNFILHQNEWFITDEEFVLITRFMEYVNV